MATAEIRVPIRSAREPGRRPAARPSGNPTATASRIADTPRASVAGTRSSTTANASVRCHTDCPKSPRSASQTNRAACVTSGSSSPRSARIRW